MTLGGKETVSKPESIEAAERASGSLKRLVRRQRCGHCAHLKSEHIPNSVCWEESYSYWEEVMLPACIYCGATCDDEEDEMCQTCWNARLTPNDQAQRRRDREASIFTGNVIAPFSEAHG